MFYWGYFADQRWNGCKWCSVSAVIFTSIKEKFTIGKLPMTNSLLKLLVILIVEPNMTKTLHENYLGINANSKKNAKKKKKKACTNNNYWCPLWLSSLPNMCDRPANNFLFLFCKNMCPAKSLFWLDKTKMWSDIQIIKKPKTLINILAFKKYIIIRYL